MIETVHMFRCDSPLCANSSPIRQGRGVTLQELRAGLKAQGWSFRYKPARDYCPRCTRENAPTLKLENFSLFEAEK